MIIKMLQTLMVSRKLSLTLMNNEEEINYSVLLYSDQIKEDKRDGTCRKYQMRNA